MIVPKKKERLDFFKALYENARNELANEFDKMARHLAQYKGSPEIDNDYGPAEKASYVRNITYELIESQVSCYIPTPCVTPTKKSDKSEVNAKSTETMLKSKRDQLPFEANNDIDERYSPIYGGSVWLTEWDESIIVDHNAVGDVKCTCIPPNRFVGQPHIYSTNDMEYCFVLFETSKCEIVRRYDVDIDELEGVASDEGNTDDTATIYVCYYRDDEDNICQYVWSGDAELLDIEDYYARKKYVCKTCGKRKELCTCDESGEKPVYELENDEFEELERDVVTSDGTIIPANSQVIKDGIPQTEKVIITARDAMGNVLLTDVGGVLTPNTTTIDKPVTEPTRLPFYKPKLMPVVIRKNTSAENSLFGQSDCEVIRPQQQAINKIESRIIEKLIKGGVFPILPDDAMLDLDNSVLEKVLRASQENINLFNKLDLEANISQDVAMADRLYDQAKRILGISDSFQGQYDGSAQSGVAKQLQIQQSAGRLASKRQLKNAAYADIDHIIFELMLAYADEPRTATYVDAMGRLQDVSFNRYDFIERDMTDGTYYYDTGYTFSADASADVEKNREFLWSENLKNLQMGAYGDPAQPQTLLIYWLNMQSAHYPYARDNVVRIQEEIRRMQEMAMLQQQLAAAGGENAELRQEIANHERYEEALKSSLVGGTQA